MERAGVHWPPTASRVIMTPARTRQSVNRARPDNRHAASSHFRGVTSTERCAVYSRKSNEEGLEMAINSLEAQRESCEAYITSQRGEGGFWFPTVTTTVAFRVGRSIALPSNGF